MRWEALLSAKLGQTSRLDAVQEAAVMALGNLCNGLLHKFWVWVGLGELPHVLQVAV